MNLVSSTALWVIQLLFLSDIFQETDTHQDFLKSIISPSYEGNGHLRSKRDTDEELLYTSSKVFPKQISVLNSSAHIGIVIDCMGEKVAILNGETGRGVVIDKVLRVGVVIERGGWINVQQDLKSYIADCNVSALMEENSKNIFQVEDQAKSSEVVKLVESNLVYFGDDLVSRLAEATGNTIKLAMDLFGFVIHPLKRVLGPIINILAEGWVVIEGGILALLNIFLWMGKLISHVVGGVARLVAKVVRFPLTLIITAVDGAQAFFYMLRELTINFDLIKLLDTILLLPAKIARFIAGLGGMVCQGITGVFNLIANLFDFKASLISYAVKGFMKILLRFFGKRRPNYVDVQRSANQLLTIADDQKKRYNNDFDPYKKFLGSVAGKGSYNVEGVEVGEVAKVLTTHESKSQIAGVLNVVKPLIPFSASMPHLLVGMVKMLNTTNGPSYLEKILPSVKIPKASLQNVNNNLLGATLRTTYSDQSPDDLKLLSAPELLKRLPVVSSIYNELDRDAQKYTNSSLDDMLKNHEAAKELVEITTKAIFAPIS